MAGQPLTEATENIGTGVTVTQIPTNTHRIGQGKTIITDPTDAGAKTEIIAPQTTPVYISTHDEGTLPAPRGAVET